MTSTAERRQVVLWLALALALAAVTAPSQAIHYRHLTLQQEVVRTEQEIVALTAAIAKVDALERRANGLEHRTYSNDKRIGKMLRDCRTREDFIVREGSRIVWGELRGSSATEKMIGVYLPPGKHRLKVGVANVSPGSVAVRRGFQGGNAREIDPLVSLGVGPEGEVYELRLQSSAAGSIDFSVYGKDNARLHDSALRGVEGPCRIRTLADERVPPSNHYVALPPMPVRDSKACYPSELAFNFNSGREFRHHPKIKPVTDLALYYLDGPSPADVRIWIESDARPCLPAITVAAHYAATTGGAYGNQTGRDRERVLAGLFDPYDGSDRFYFRDELFEQ